MCFTNLRMCLGQELFRRIMFAHVLHLQTVFGFQCFETWWSTSIDVGMRWDRKTEGTVVLSPVARCCHHALHVLRSVLGFENLNFTASNLLLVIEGKQLILCLSIKLSAGGIRLVWNCKFHFILKVLILKRGPFSWVDTISVNWNLKHPSLNDGCFRN